MDAPQPQPGILDLTPYRAFAPPKHVGRIVRLVANEGALGPSPRAIEAFRRAADRIHRYPDRGSPTLLQAMAKRHGFETERLIVGNGSDELIELLCHCYCGPGDEIVYTQYGFIMYRVSAQAAGATPVMAPDVEITASVDAILERVTPRTKIVFLANPNNPTGTYLPHREVERLQRELPNRVLLVIDAAYAEYVDRNDYSDGSELARRSPNVIMLRTFSKLFALAGLRLGWGYGSPAIMDVLNRVHGPFNVNLAAQEAGAAALADIPFQDAGKTHNRIWMPRAFDRLTAMGLEPRPSVANFMIVRVPERTGKTADAAVAHLASRGIFVRESASYGLPDHFRFSIGTDDDMALFLCETAAFMGHGHV